MSTNHIVKHIELNAHVARVWRALTDYKEFAEWFCLILDTPFAPGKKVDAILNYPGMERLKWQITIDKIEPETLFSFYWHPHAINPEMDYSKEEKTLVEFRLEKISGGTSLTVTESGFDSLPASRRDEAFRMNSEGWKEQLENIKKYVTH